MVRSIALFALVLVFFGIRAYAGEPACYVKAGDKVYFGQDIKLGVIHTRIISPDGTVIKVHNRDIKAYMHDNRLFQVMPVICGKNDTVCQAMMEFLAVKSGLSLYRYDCPNHCDVYFFVFKDGKFYQRIDQEQAQAELARFGVKVI